MTNKRVWVNLEFEPCDQCRVRPDAPLLCHGCRNNRAVIARLRKHAETGLYRQRQPRGCLCTDIADANIDCPIHGR
jgi:hypothetical protein